MRRFRFKKLVRDGVLESMLARGDKPKYRQLSGDELLQAIEAKIIEEAQEIDLAYKDADTLEEIADVIEILDLAVAESGFTWDDVKIKRHKKREKAGGFNGKYFIEYADVKDNDPWIEHFLSHPDRYPELKSKT